jgi:hypothetical protein
MILKQRLTHILPTGKKRLQILIICLLTVMILLCGFTWDWVIEFTMQVLFPADEAVDAGLIFDFGDIVNPDDLRVHLTEPLIAEQIANGVRANLSANVYSDIEIPDIRQEELGSKIIRTIFDRLFA